MPEYEDDFRTRLKEALHRLLEATASDTSEHSNRSRTWVDREEDYDWARAQLKSLGEITSLEDILIPVLGESCGDNEHWEGVAWHLGPGAEPNTFDGDWYLIFSEGTWSVVRYHISKETDSQIDICYDFASEELSEFLKKTPSTEWKDKLRDFS